MTTRNLLTILFVIGAVHRGFGQWVMEITVSGSPKSCPGYATYNFSASFGSYSYSTTTYGYTGKVTSTDGTFVGTINGGGSANCSCVDPHGNSVPGCTGGGSSGSGSLDVNHTAADGPQCITGSASYSSTDFIGNISYRIYKILDKPIVTPSTGTCSDASLQLSTAGVASSYFWSVTDNPAGGIWVGLYSKNTATITVTYQDLQSTYFTSGSALRYVRVSDNSCDYRQSAVSNSFNINLPPPTGANVAWSEPKCNGGDDGIVTINGVTGGPSPISVYNVTLKILDASNNYSTIYQQIGAYPNAFVIDKAKIYGQVGGAIQSITKGSYQLIIANQYGGSCAYTTTFSIGEPTPLTASANLSSPIKCHGDTNGVLQAAGSGGTPGYSYSWTGGPSTATYAGLGPATYTVKVTDANACTATASNSLTDPFALDVSVAVNTALICDESNNGILAATGSGGTPNYSYTWSTAETGSLAHNLTKGNYSVTITDAHNCTLTKGATLGAPPAVVLAASATTNYYGSNISCNGLSDGAAIAAVQANGMPPYNFMWSTGETSAQIYNLSATTYNVGVTDAIGCKANTSVTLTQPPPVAVAILPSSSFHGSYISCHGKSDGVLTTNVTNSVGAIMYRWSDGSNGNTLQNVPAGHYTVDVKDGRGCLGSKAYDLFDPDEVVPVITVTSNYHGQAISCNGKTDAFLNTIVTGGTGAYSYSWNNGSLSSLVTDVGAGDYMVTVTDANNCNGTDLLTVDDPAPVIASILNMSDYAGFGVTCLNASDGSLTASTAGGTGVYSYSWSNGVNAAAINNLSAGDYTVTVQDNNGCKDNITATITTPTAIAFTVSNVKNVSCNQGSDGIVTLQASGGAGQYQYSKDDANWQPATIFDQLNANSYTFFLKDANNCNAQIATQVNEPTKIQISFSGIAPAYCADPRGTATGVVTGGVGNYQYSWQDYQNNVVSSTAIMENVKAGIYTLNITDGNLCPASNSVPITSTDGAKTTFTATTARCFDSYDGSAAIVITEGDGPFVIQWPDNQNTLEAVNLKGGVYYVLVTDVHNCTIIQEADVPAPLPIQLAVASQTMPTCNGDCNGQMTLAASGGVGNYSYAWNGLSSPQQLQLCAKVYPVHITDDNGCFLDQDVELKQPDPLRTNVVNETLATCRDGCNGSLDIIATGGNGLYQYTWFGGGSAASKENICPGIYIVTVNDQKGCSYTNTVTLENTPKVPLDLGGSVTLCVGQSYSLDAGSDWTSIKWGSNTGFISTDEKITIKDPGQYWLETFNTKGCVAQDTFLLKTSYDLLKARFIVPDQAYVQDTVAMIDVTWPMPEKIEWQYPDNMMKIYDNGTGIIYGEFDSAGYYPVTMKAYLGECKDQMTKSITILANEAQPNTSGRLGYQEFVKEFKLYPNPNMGAFDVSVELEQESAIGLSIWGTITNYKISQYTEGSSKQFVKKFDLKTLTPGVYVLRLDHSKGTDYIRFVIE